MTTIGWVSLVKVGSYEGERFLEGREGRGLFFAFLSWVSISEE